ncbi:YciI family protein [Leptospira fluminis]|uniref:YciI family protein n=1 Tax=Leptospira fluminis TaxID=2484979 RepID=A0A4R9GPQ3_9LEPT|nr:YciI family protein [Leptospira fluminis]TGK19018.1 YciI family protein [Leptospira fluminis]
MKYQLLIYIDEKLEASRSKQELEQRSEDYTVYTQELLKSGKMVGGDRLHPTSSAATVKLREGKRITTHGPFAETKEQLGGYYLVDCSNLDEALDWAAKCPGAKHGTMEVRPVYDLGPKPN